MPAGSPGVSASGGLVLFVKTVLDVGLVADLA